MQFIPMNRCILTLTITLFIVVGKITAQNLADLEKANEAYFKKNYETALVYYNRYLQSNNRIPKVLFNRGVCLLNTGQYVKAISDFQEALKLNASFSEAYYNIGLAYQRLGKYEEAIRNFEKKADRSESLRRISECYRSMGIYSRANSYEEMAIAKEAENQLGLDLQAAPKQQTTTTTNDVSVNANNRPTGQQQIANAKGNPMGISPAKNLLSEARRLTENERYAEAEEKCTQVINHYKEERKAALDWRGNVRIRLRKFNEAIQDFDQSLLIDPTDAWTLNQRGFAKMEINLLAEAEKDFKAAIDIDPSSPARENLATLDTRRLLSIAKDDKQGPAVKILSPLLAELGGRGLSLVSAGDSRITIVGIAEDLSGIREVQLNTTIAKLSPLDASGQRVQFTATIPAQEGENIIYFVAKDAANNETKKLYKYIAQVQVSDNEKALSEKVEAKNLLGKNYALLIGTDEYIHWDRLNNPVRDVNAIAHELKHTYGFEVDLLINPANKAVIERKLIEWASRKYQRNDQLFVFIAGHGFFIPYLEKGFIIPKEGLPAHIEKDGSSWVSHDFIRHTLEHSNSHHVFLVIDACFSGTISPAVAVNRGLAELSLSMREMVARKIHLKTRKYLTSGGKEYVPDGQPNAHSPFAAQLLRVLREKGKYSGGLLTINDIRRAVQNLNPQPHSGDFPYSSGDPESDFFFIPVNN